MLWARCQSSDAERGFWSQARHRSHCLDLHRNFFLRDHLCGIVTSNLSTPLPQPPNPSPSPTASPLPIPRNPSPKLLQPNINPPHPPPPCNSRHNQPQIPQQFPLPPRNPLPPNPLPSSMPGRRSVNSRLRHQGDILLVHDLEAAKRGCEQDFLTCRADEEGEG